MSRRGDVWTDVVGQEPTVRILQQAVAGAERALDGKPSARMTHAWLLTGPPGSGRSNSARAFAAALVCPTGGCGECGACRTALAGSHPDVTLVRTTQLSIKVDEVRELVRKAALSPAGSRWQVIVIEDADRLTEQAADALLKSLEEPAERTVWVLCAPTVEDVVPTIRSRARLVVLRTPPPEAVAKVLMERDGVAEAIAGFAARASQGHIGRARALATDEATRNRRHEVLSLPFRLRDLGACLNAADNLVKAAAEEAAPLTDRLDTQERSELEQALGLGTRGVRPRGSQAAVKELSDSHKTRAKRLQRDVLDRALTDLMSFYRDVLLVQMGATSALVNEELRSEVTAMARSVPPETTLMRIEEVLACRKVVEENVAPLLAVEALMVALL